MTADSVGFDRAATYYDATRGFPPGVDRGAAALVSRVGGLTPESRVLEIGAGTGRIALPVSRHIGEYYGIDVSASMLARLRGKQDGHKVYTAQADATYLPFPNSSFDAVIAVHVFHLIARWQHALREVARVLRPGGKLLHCWGGRMVTFDVLMTAWRSVIPDEENQTVGANYETQPDFLEDEGWQPLSAAEKYPFTYQKTPQEHVDQLAGRVWSRTWRLSDETLQAGIAAVQAALQAHYGDPTIPVTVETDFTAQAFQPPLG
ncbi:MAG: class I SAM-dependent methyltransferase [Anaerolineaceae bacterium]|nr:class I SAM-dependent methyltransferase [Anaerolineaceae bacterium]